MSSLPFWRNHYQVSLRKRLKFIKMHCSQQRCKFSNVSAFRSRSSSGIRLQLIISKSWTWHVTKTSLSEYGITAMICTTGFLYGLIYRLRTRLVCLHTPPTLACTAIFLTTRDLQIKLPSGWMEIFDVDIQDIVHSAAHLKIFYHEEAKRVGTEMPLTLTELEDYLRKKREESLTWPKFMHLISRFFKQRSNES